MSGSALSLIGVDKSFDGHRALQQACLDVEWGEVHALLGENGAGKSTLMNIVCGLYTADDGVVQVKGKPVSVKGPASAIQYGIGMVHQHFKLVGPFSVAENVLLACNSQLKINSVEAAARLTLEAADKLGFTLDPGVRADALSVAECQRLEIIKLILLGADILVLDEPTAVLTDTESDTVLALLQDMAKQGKAVILITHRLREVTRFADRVTIMRNGQTVLQGADARKMDISALAQSMVGETLKESANHFDVSIASDNPVRLSLQNIHVSRSNGSTALQGVSFDVKAGEILGVAGVGGNGQTELMEAIYGLQAIDQGKILIDGTDLSTVSIKNRRQRGLRVVPADRFDFALLAELRAYENLGLTDINQGKFGSAWLLSRGQMKKHAEALFTRLDITGGSIMTRSRLLSGGNAQKLLLARELDGELTVLVAHSPTRGLDVRACQSVHETIINCTKGGAACLLISEDLDEILSLSSRIAVISRGVVHGPFEPDAVSRAQIGELMAGHT